MIEIDFFFALVTFYVVMYVTPGPNNAIILASGLRFGFLKTIPVILGITIGHVFQLILVCSGLGKIFELYPGIQFYLKIFCSCYILFIAIRILGSLTRTQLDNSKPIKFYEAALFQIVNPKAWTISSIAASSFLVNGLDLVYSIGLLAGVAVCVCPISIGPWAVFGAVIKNLIVKNKSKIFIELMLAFLLVITSLLVLLQI